MLWLHVHHLPVQPNRDFSLIKNIPSMETFTITVQPEIPSAIVAHAKTWSYCGAKFV
jgi:hypothetical protein